MKQSTKLVLHQETINNLTNSKIDFTTIGSDSCVVAYPSCFPGLKK